MPTQESTTIDATGVWLEWVAAAWN